MTKATSSRWLIAGCLVAGVATATAVVTSAKDHGNGSGYVVISDEQDGATSHGYLGVSVQRLRSRLRDALEIPSSVSGLMITNVHDDTPAEVAGLLNQDVILRVNNQPVGDEDEFTDLIRSFKPETRVTISIWRDGGSKDITVMLGKPPRVRVESWGGGDGPQAFSWNSDEDDDGEVHVFRVPSPPHAPRVPHAPNAPQWHGMTPPNYPGSFEFHQLGQLGQLSQIGNRGRLGIEIQELNEGIAPFFGVKGGEGVLVWRVMDDSPADKAGIQAGDVITEIEGQSIDSTTELREDLADLDDGDSVAVTWLRGGKSQSAGVTLTESDAPNVYMYSEHPKRGSRRSANRSMEQVEREMDELQRRMEGLRRDLERLKD